MQPEQMDVPSKERSGLTLEIPRPDGKGKRNPGIPVVVVNKLQASAEKPGRGF